MSKQQLKNICTGIYPLASYKCILAPQKARRQEISAAQAARGVI